MPGWALSSQPVTITSKRTQWVTPIDETAMRNLTPLALLGLTVVVGRMRLDGCRAAAVPRGSTGRIATCDGGAAGADRCDLSRPPRRSRHARPRLPRCHQGTRRARWRWPRRSTCGACVTGAAAATPRGSTAAGWCSTSSRGRASPCHGMCGGNSRLATRFPPTAVRAGDLLFFDTESNGASHVAIALDGQTFVHAPNSRGVVRVERLSAGYWSRRLLGARRIE